MLIGNTVTAMQAQMRTFSTKADLGAMVGEIKQVKEAVKENSVSIDKLFDLRKTDRAAVSRQIEEAVDKRQGANFNDPINAIPFEHEAQFSRSRKSVRVWPVSEVNELERSVRSFFSRYLKAPPNLVRDIQITSIVRQQQARRSKIQHKVLVTFDSIQSRDAIQSYAPNLAEAGAGVGLRLDVPDYLRGIFRLFEEHAAALCAKYGTVKRSIRFDDMAKSLLMDVKLEHTRWPRITAVELCKRKANRNDLNQLPSGAATEQDPEKRDVLLIDEPDKNAEKE